MIERLLRRQEVLARIGIKTYSTLWRWITRDHFPHAVELSPPGAQVKRVAWRETDVDAWIASRPVREGGFSPMKRHLARKLQASGSAVQARPRRVLPHRVSSRDAQDEGTK